MLFTLMIISSVVSGNFLIRIINVVLMLGLVKLDMLETVASMSRRDTGRVMHDEQKRPVCIKNKIYKVK